MKRSYKEGESKSLSTYNFAIFWWRNHKKLHICLKMIVYKFCVNTNVTYSIYRDRKNSVLI